MLEIVQKVQSGDGRTRQNEVGAPGVLQKAAEPRRLQHSEAGRQSVK
jgi:hypothetical protein